MTKRSRFKAWINPLQFVEVDQPPILPDKELPSAEGVLQYMCTPGTDSNVGSLVRRYRETSEGQVQLFVAPVEERILEKLVWPLRNARVSYMLGNYLGAISLCGMVAEMVAVLLFEISDPMINNRPMTVEHQKSVFGRTFEQLGQYRRIDVLEAYGVIDNAIRQKFDRIRVTRRKYLHLWSQDHELLPGDAISVYRAATDIVVRAIGQDFKDGAVMLNPALVKYLERSGGFEAGDEGA
jgi:hypothetical protein